MNADELLVREDKKVVESLRFAGIRVDSVYDLVNTSQAYPAAIPVLVSSLSEVRHPRILDGIARALSVEEAKPYARVMVEFYRSFDAADPAEEQAKWAVANAVAVVGSDAIVDDVIALMSDAKHGWTRSMLPLALVKAIEKRAVAVTALIAALSDDDLAPRAADALAKLSATEAIPDLKLLANHHDGDMRRVVAKALRKLEKKQE